MAVVVGEDRIRGHEMPAWLVITLNRNTSAGREDILHPSVADFVCLPEM